MSGWVVRGYLPQNDKKAQYYRMGSLEPFALVLWDIRLDIYKYILTEGIVRALPGTGGRPLCSEK
jgi:hypothetical protein